MTCSLCVVSSTWSLTSGPEVERVADGECHDTVGARSARLCPEPPRKFLRFELQLGSQSDSGSVTLGGWRQALLQSGRRCFVRQSSNRRCKPALFGVAQGTTDAVVAGGAGTRLAP